MLDLLKQKYFPSKNSKTRSQLLLGTAMLAISSLFLPVQPTIAKSCTPFPVIGGEGTEVKKTVSVPGIPVPFGLQLNNNWNTDFAISPLKRYRSYVTKFTAETEGEYTIRVYLKYSNNTADEVYNQKNSFTPGQSLNITGSPRTEEIPYQVNVFVGEVESVRKSYIISVEGCM